MENKKKILISIMLITIIIVGIIVYIINNKSNDELNLNSLIVENGTESSNKTIKENVDKAEEIVTEIVVHIIGEVKKSGVVSLEEGARLIDAIKKAGGETKNADLSQVNLAYKLKDGDKIYIPNKNEKITEYIVQGNGDNIVSVGEEPENNLKGENKKVNINTANQEELDTLPGIGETTAQKIIEYRETNGKFNKIEDLQNVKGIGESKYSEIKDKITV